MHNLLTVFSFMKCDGPENIISTNNFFADEKRTLT